MRVHLSVAVELAEVYVDERGVQVCQQTFCDQPFERPAFGMKVVEMILEADQLGWCG